VESGSPQDGKPVEEAQDIGSGSDGSRVIHVKDCGRCPVSPLSAIGSGERTSLTTVSERSYGERDLRLASLR
jgi:hypothetical protein